MLGGVGHERVKGNSPLGIETGIKGIRGAISVKLARHAAMLVPHDKWGVPLGSLVLLVLEKR